MKRKAGKRWDIWTIAFLLVLMLMGLMLEAVVEGIFTSWVVEEGTAG